MSLIVKKSIHCLIIVFAALVIFSCPTEKDNQNKQPEPSIDDLAGTFKTTAQWGTLVQKFPNNVGNTFTSDPKTTRTITWQSSIATGEVITGKNHYPSTSTLNNGWYFHRVNITGLTAGKTYRYIAGSKDAYSPVYTFTTESTNSSGDFYLLHVTDPQIGSGNDAAVWRNVIESAVIKFPDAAFVANTGDMVENCNAAIIPFYFDYAQKIIANYAFMYSMGNNDLTAWYNHYFYTPGSNGVLYSFNYGNVHFINIDSNVKLGSAQMTALENDLKNAKQKWKVVLTHEADYGRTGSNTALTKLFDKYNVDLVMAGHNHFYARSKPIDTAGNEKQNGTVWTIPNTAGTKFNETSGENYLAMDKQPNLPMFSKLRFTDNHIELEAYTVKNGVVTLFDTYFLSMP